MDNTSTSLRLATTPVVCNIIDQILRDGARQMLQKAIEREVADYVEQRASALDADGHRLVVRNGSHPKRSIQTGSGSIEICQPRVNDKRVDEKGERLRFTSKILPPYLRKTKAIEELVPWLYLKGISTGGFSDALTALGHDGSGLSATSVVRMKEVWQGEWELWGKRSLADKKYVYLWADGIHFNVRLEDEGSDHQCILVLMGATQDGDKELIAINEGFRESEQSWLTLLRDVRARGLQIDPKLATGDGALGFWKALPQVFPTTLAQRCWVHKTANVLDKLPKSLQPAAKDQVHQIWMSATQADATKAFDAFIATHEAKHPKAAECLAKDRAELLAFYSFPAEHWQHLRTTNPIESTFATVRLRTVRTKGSGSRRACLTMVFKLCQSAARTWRKLKGRKLLPDVIQGVQFVDGLKKNAA
jgi:transposase-like protein